MHRLILTVVLLTSKMFNDIYYTNTYVAQIGGISLKNINQLEKYFTKMLDWRLNISTEEFEFYSNCVLIHSQEIKACRKSRQLPMLPTATSTPVEHVFANPEAATSQLKLPAPTELKVGQFLHEFTQGPKMINGCEYLSAQLKPAFTFQEYLVQNQTSDSPAQQFRYEPQPAIELNHLFQEAQRNYEHNYEGMMNK